MTQPPAPLGDRPADHAGSAGIVELRSRANAVARFWKSTVAILVLAVAAAAVLTYAETPVYQTSMTFFVATNGSASQTALQGDQYAQQRINSYVGVLKSEAMADIVITDTRVDLTPTEVSAAINPSADPDTVLLTVDVRDVSAERSKLMADAVDANLDGLIGRLESRSSKASVQLQLISGPTLAPDPVSPRKTLNLAIGLLLGVALGVGQALLRQQLDTTYRSADDLTQRTGYPTLAVLNFDSEAKQSPVLAPQKGHSRRAETFRQLRTNLRFADIAKHVQVLVVTSSVESEGKSSTAANLAISFAQSGRSVLLMDADLRKPRLDAYLDVEGSAGVTSVLLGDAEPGHVVQDWAAPGLSVLTSGPVPPNPSELLGSPQMEKLLAELRNDYDLVVIDSPPLLPVTDAAVVATMADGVVVAVRHGSTRGEQLGRSLRTLESVDARILGTVLTFAPSTRRDRLPEYYLQTSAD